MNIDYYVKARELAGRAGVSLPVLCQHAGVSRGTPGQWQGGAHSPTLRTWQALEAAAARLIAIRTRAEQAEKAGAR